MLLHVVSFFFLNLNSFEKKKKIVLVFCKTTGEKKKTHFAICLRFCQKYSFSIQNFDVVQEFNE